MSKEGKIAAVLTIGSYAIVGLVLSKIKSKREEQDQRKMEDLMKQTEECIKNSFEMIDDTNNIFDEFISKVTKDEES